MKKAVVLACAILFAASMCHYFYAEDHCPLHCPSRGGQFGHGHPHHPAASTCLCFWTSLLGPETDDFIAAIAFVSVLARSDDLRALPAAGADIAHPPKSCLA
jgi:hypothetical protein